MVNLLKFFKKSKQVFIHCPVKGVIVPLDQVDDRYFYSESLGTGIAVGPEKGVIVSPADGIVEDINETGNSIAIRAVHSVELLIYIGSHDEKHNKKDYIQLVKRGDKITIGQPLIRFDLDRIEKRAMSSLVSLVIENTYDFGNIKIEKAGHIESGEIIASLTK